MRLTVPLLTVSLLPIGGLAVSARHFHWSAIHVAWVHGILAGGKHQLPLIHRFVVEGVAIAHLARFAADDTMQIMHYLLELLGALVCGPRPATS